MHVPVDDRDTARPERGLRPARGDRDVVEQAKAHCPVALGVTAGRTCEREAAAPHRLDRGACREQCRLVGRLGADCVSVDPAARGAHLLQEPAAMATEHVVLDGRRTLDERKVFLQHGHPLLRLRMTAGRVQLRERRVAYELDARTASRISSSGRSVRRRPIR